MSKAQSCCSKCAQFMHLHCGVLHAVEVPHCLSPTANTLDRSWLTPRTFCCLPFGAQMYTFLLQVEFSGNRIISCSALVSAASYPPRDILSTPGVIRGLCWGFKGI